LNKAKELIKGEDYFSLGIEKIDKSPDDAKAIYELAAQAGELQKWEKAINLWQRHNALSPDVPAAYVNMSTAYQKIGRLDQAIESIRRAMELAPDMEEPPDSYALYRILQGKAEEAIPVLELLGKTSPGNITARFKLAAAYACTGRKETALKILEKLKCAINGPGLVRACRSMAKELTSFGQSQYAAAMIEITARIFVESSPDQSV
jgi:tetratricopeptide (TPR) repeat protein